MTNAQFLAKMEIARQEQVVKEKAYYAAEEQRNLALKKTILTFLLLKKETEHLTVDDIVGDRGYFGVNLLDPSRGYKQEIFTFSFHESPLA